MTSARRESEAAWGRAEKIAPVMEHAIRKAACRRRARRGDPSTHLEMAKTPNLWISSKDTSYPDSHIGGRKGPELCLDQEIRLQRIENFGRISFA